MTKRLIVYFLYNTRGISAYTHVVGCEVPAEMEIEDVMKGFWIVDNDGKLWPQGEWPYRAKMSFGGGDMWVPPGRITGIQELK
jgi:hypothetical protein